MTKIKVSCILKSNKTKLYKNNKIQFYVYKYTALFYIISQFVGKFKKPSNVDNVRKGGLNTRNKKQNDVKS